MPTSPSLAPIAAGAAIFQYAVVKITGAPPTTVVLDGAVGTDFAFGILQTKTTIAGDSGPIETRPGYRSRAVASAAFAAGTRLMVGSGADAGKVLTLVGDVFLVAIALEASTGAGHIVTVLTVFDKMLAA